MKSQQGFATVLMLSLLPVLLAFAAATLFTFSFLKQDLGTLNVCRAQQLEVQGKVAKILDKLFGLNPKALRLRYKQRLADQRLQAALLSGNTVAIAAAETAQVLVTLHRAALDAEQKALLASAQVVLRRSAGVREAQGIQREWQAHQQPMNTWLKGSFEMSKSKNPELAVRPDQPDLAPVYEPAVDFEEKQTWIQSWKVQFRVVGVFQKFLTFGGRFPRSCSTSLYSEGKKWTAKLKDDTGKKAKFLSKAFF